jgi:CRISPR-associated protein Csx17
VLPIDVDNPRQWGRADDPGFVFSVRPLVDNLHALLMRDDIEAWQHAPQGRSDDARITAFCRLDDLARFIEGDVDDVTIERWARAASLLSRPPRFDDPGDAIGVPAAYAVLRLVHSGALLDSTKLKRTSAMLARACAGDSVGATTAALQRLSVVGRALPIAAFVEPSQRMRRIAAALAFPTTTQQRRQLEDMVLPPRLSPAGAPQPIEPQTQQETA